MDSFVSSSCIGVVNSDFDKICCCSWIKIAYTGNPIQFSVIALKCKLIIVGKILKDYYEVFQEHYEFNTTINYV